MQRKTQSLCATQLIREGPGIPLVFLHGFLGRMQDWEPVCSLLPPCTCIGVDLPGHGSSPFYKEFLFTPPAPRFHLIGYSMGGRLAIEYAAKHLNSIDRLVLISTHSGLILPSERNQRIRSDQLWAQRLLRWPIDEFLTHWYDQPVFADYRPDFSTRRNQRVQDLASCLVHYSLGRRPVENSKEAIHIVGEKDAKYRTLHPYARIVSKAGHALHMENPRDLAKILEEILL